jgi:hypothetical protein
VASVSAASARPSRFPQHWQHITHDRSNVSQGRRSE